MIGNGTWRCRPVRLYQTAQPKVFLDNDIYINVSKAYRYGCHVYWIHTVDSSHDESNLRGICGTCEMSVNLLLFGLIQRDKSVKDVVTSSRIIGTP